MISHSELLERLSYDPDTGVFVWINTSKYRQKCSGKIAGWITEKGYIKITINRKNYLSHRLAWFYVLGVFQKNQLDHINHIINDNRIINLREVCQEENMQNQIKAQKNNFSGFLGVSSSNFKDYGILYQARIQTNNKRISLGLYKTPEEAYGVYLKAKRELHSTCTI
jgi:hypothetical protein